MAILSAGRSPPPPPTRFAPRDPGDGLDDLVKETCPRLTPGRPALTAWLALCVAAARAHGCDIIDGVYNDLTDLAGFKAECEQGRDMGLDGKTLIHPNQIEICNATFAPTAAVKIEVAPARSSSLSRRRRTPAATRSSSTAAWSNCCTNRWRAERWRLRKASPRCSARRSEARGSAPCGASGFCWQ